MPLRPFPVRLAAVRPVTSPAEVRKLAPFAQGADVPAARGEERLEPRARGRPGRPAGGVEDEVVAVQRIGRRRVLSGSCCRSRSGRP